MSTPNTPAHSIKDSREIGDTEHANAAHIVLCVNSHDKLREALRETLAQLPYGNEALALKAQAALKESEAK